MVRGLVCIAAIVLLSGCAGDGSKSPDEAKAPASAAAEPRETTRGQAPPTAEGAGAGDGSGAEAPELPPLSDREREIGLAFQPLADQFGLTRYVNVQRTATGRGLVFEYLPEGEEIESWSYLGVLVLTRVGSTWEEGVESLPRYFQAFAERAPVVNTAVTWPYPEGAVSFLEYETGTGEAHQHVLAAMWQVFPGHLAVFQAQRRPDRFADWQIEHFVSVAMRLGRADQAPPAPESEEPGE